MKLTDEQIKGNPMRVTLDGVPVEDQSTGIKEFMRQCAPINYKMAWRGANSEIDYQSRLIATLENALRYAAQWIGEVPHGDNCFVSNHYAGDPGNQCNCGKDSVLDVMNKALPDSEEV